MDDLLNHAPCGFLSFTDDGKIALVNATLLKILGYESEDLQGQPVETIFSIASRIFHQTHFFPLLKMRGKADEIFLSLRTKSGDDVPVLINAIRQKRKRQTFNDCVFMSMQRRHEYEEQILFAKKTAEQAIRLKDEINASLEEVRIALETRQVELLIGNARLEILAVTDGLTGLKNHRAFQENLEFQISLAERIPSTLSILLIDIDYFKKINDSFGHPAGDAKLRSIAKILQQNSRGVDFVARYGGEEFAVILPGTDQTGAIISAEKLRRAIETVSWSDMATTVSIGAATLSADINNKSSLIASADRALYLSKKDGRNRVTHVNDLKSSNR